MMLLFQPLASSIALPTQSLERNAEQVNVGSWHLADIGAAFEPVSSWG